MAGSAAGEADDVGTRSRIRVEAQRQQKSRRVPSYQVRSGMALQAAGAVSLAPASMDSVDHGGTVVTEALGGLGLIRW